jgi:hypothetical protein
MECDIKNVSRPAIYLKTIFFSTLSHCILVVGKDDYKVRLVQAFLAVYHKARYHQGNRNKGDFVKKGFLIVYAVSHMLA